MQLPIEIFLNHPCSDIYTIHWYLMSLNLVGLRRALVLLRLVNDIVETKSLRGGFSAAGNVVCKEFPTRVSTLHYFLTPLALQWVVHKLVCAHLQSENELILSFLPVVGSADHVELIFFFFYWVCQWWIWPGFLQLAAFLEILHSALGMHIPFLHVNIEFM